MGRYLTNEQVARARDELSLLYSLPYSIDLVGTAWEQILAEIKGGSWTEKRDNRPRPDVTVTEGDKSVNYSVKTERLRTTGRLQTAADFLGHSEDLIVARPKVDELLAPGEKVESLSADQLGRKVLEYYNARIVRAYQWDVLSILLRVEDNEFIYWEERPAPTYDPDGFWWRDSGRATGDNRNINGYPVAVRQAGALPLPRAKFKWTSGGKQFYVLYAIPNDADTWKITRTDLSIEEVREALRDKLRAKQQGRG